MMEAEVRGPLANMDVPTNPGDILLRVKSASHPSCEDLEFHVQASFSVKKIKEEIKRLSAQHPEIKEQRLIFSGHLLDDNQVLKDVLTGNCGSQINALQQPVTFHLACTSKYIFSPTSSSSKSSQKPQPDLPGTGGIPQQPIFSNQFVTPDFGIPQQGGDNVPQDVMSLHQAYVEQMTAYMNQWYMHQGMMTGMFTQMPPTPNYYQQPQQVPPAAAPAPPRNDPPPAPRAQENINLAAARAIDDEENQRDLLDWMYTLSRAVLVFSVVYFYSSFSRFLLVIVFTGLVMVLQRRNGQPQPQPNQNAEGRNVNNNVPPRPAANAEGGDVNPDAAANPEVQNADNEAVAGENPRAATDEPPAHPEPPPPPQRNMQEIAWTFLTTFFTSLIPENYQNN